MENHTNITLSLPSTHKRVINHVLKKIIGNNYIDSIFLFGSCAKGAANENSDIDLFVITHDKIYDENHEAFDILYGSTDDIPLEDYISCDILTATKEEFNFNSTPLIKKIKKEGIKLNGLL